MLLLVVYFGARDWAPGSSLPNGGDDRGGMFERMLFPTSTVVAFAESATHTALDDVVTISQPLTVITYVDARGHDRLSFRVEQPCIGRTNDVKLATH